MERMERDEKIKKTLSTQVSNLGDYNQFCKSFSWDQARRNLTGLPHNQGLNIAFEAIDRHANGSLADHTAIRWLGKGNERKNFTYKDLKTLTNKFANILKTLGVSAGDSVFTLTGRIPELYISALGTWKNKSVFCPLFSAFGPEPIRSRLVIGKAKVLVTTEELYRKKIIGIKNSLPDLQHILIIGDTPIEGSFNFGYLLREASDQFSIPPTKPDDIAILHFTSGTTGKPKGAIHVHEAVVAHHATGQIALDFHPNDVFWCTADPGWVTGTSYGIISPLTHGITSIVDESDFDAERWYRILQDEKISIWYTAPTAVRMMMKHGFDDSEKYDLSFLRFIASVGEPLNPEAVWWGQEAFNLPIHDNWWQTETGGIMIANYISQDIKPGSMGKPMPGVDAVIVQRDFENRIQIATNPNVEGELALKVGWPSMFRGYLGEEDRYRKCFVGEYYLTGDLVKRDTEGYFWFVGRADDVIKSAGHLIGPFEVESILMEHPAIAEAAVIGKPDPISKEFVKAFVALKKGFRASEDLKLEILGFARKRLGAAIAPKEVDILASIPKTRSGKLMRRLLKARELGLPEGDISTLETNL